MGRTKTQQGTDAVARTVCRRRLVLPTVSLLLGLLGSCQTWSVGGGADDRTLATELEPAAAAWVAAATARGCFPGADPMPRHAGAPVARQSADRFVLHYARSGTDGYRVRMNGRLLPPRALSTGQVCAVAGVVFRRESTLTRAALAAADSAVVTIEPRGEGSRLSIRVAGRAREAGLEPAIERALRLAEALEESARCIRARDLEQAVLVTEVALAPAPTTTVPHTLLRSRLRLHRALARVEQGRLAEARPDLARALADDPDHRAAQLLRVRLDARTASERDLKRHLLALSQLPGQPALAHSAAVQHQRLHARRDGLDRAGTLREHAAAWLARGDGEAALRWIRIARASAPPSALTLELEARIYRQLGMRRAAHDTALLELGLHGFRPSLVLALHDDCVALGQVETGMRRLARHWGLLHGSHLAAARRRIESDATLTGTDLAVRLLLSEDRAPHDLSDLLRADPAAPTSESLPATPSR